MSTVIRSLMVKVGADLSGMQKGLQQASKDLKSAGKQLSSMGSSMTKGITMPIVGAVAGLTSLAVKASETADEMITMSTQLGISTQSLQKLQYASKFVDVEVETMAKGMAKVTKATGAAAAKGQGYIEIAEGLKVSTKDVNGNLLDSEDVFYKTIDALGSMTNETEREIAAQNLFGKSYQDLMPLIKAGSGELKKLGEEAKEVGAIMSDEGVNALGKFNDQVEKFKAVISTAGTRIGAAFVPVLEKLAPIIMEKIVPAISGLADKLSKLLTWFDKLSPGSQKFLLTMVGLLVALGPVLSVIGKLSTGFGGIVGSVGKAVKVFSGGGGIISALGALAGPGGIVLLVIAGIAALAAIVFLVIKNWSKIKDFFKNLWEGIKKVTKSVVDFLVKLFLKFTPQGLIIKHWGKIKDFFKNLWEGVKSVTSKAWEFLKNLFLDFTIVGLIIKNFAGIKSFFSDLWGSVKNIFREAINFILKGINLIPGVEIPLLKDTSTKKSTRSKYDNMESYAIGTDYVPKTGPAYLHKGEAVIPADQNNGYSGGTVNHTGTIRVVGVNNQNELIGVTKLIADQTQRDARRFPSAAAFSPA